MIKTYMPNALMRAAMDIAKVHSKEDGVQVLQETELVALLERIIRCNAKQLQLLAMGLTSKEIYALCRYLPHNKFKKPLVNIINAIQHNMHERYFEELFLQWQKYPNNRTVLKLLAENDNKEVRVKQPKIPVGKFSQWYSSSNCFIDVVSYIRSISNKYDSFDKQFEDAGFRVGYPIQTECLTAFLLSCDMYGYIQIGDSKIAQSVQKSSTSTAELILLNLLLAGRTQKTTLRDFKQCYAVMLNLWREPYSGRFPKNQPDAQRVYYFLYNYEEMVSSFAADADHRRRNFWEQYLDRCEITKIKKHRMLIFNFDNCCAIEFEVVGRIFIYEKEYFNKKVRPRAQQEQSTQTLKNWMFHNSTFEYEKWHKGQWESEVAYKLRKYI